MKNMFIIYRFSIGASSEITLLNGRYLYINSRE